MGREASKAKGNIWYEARMKAAEYDKRLLSREGAAELLGMSVSSVSDTELDICKCMPADKAVLMADLYNAPHLLNHYCVHECPIGKNKKLSTEVVNIDRVVVRLMNRLRAEKVSNMKDRLIEIAEDGVISQDEVEDIKSITEYLESLVTVFSELKIIADGLKVK